MRALWQPANFKKSSGHCSENSNDQLSSLRDGPFEIHRGGYGYFWKEKIYCHWICEKKYPVTESVRWNILISCHYWWRTFGSVLCRVPLSLLTHQKSLEVIGFWGPSSWLTLEKLSWTQYCNPTSYCLGYFTGVWYHTLKFISFSMITTWNSLHQLWKWQSGSRAYGLLLKIVLTFCSILNFRGPMGRQPISL